MTELIEAVARAICHANVEAGSTHTDESIAAAVAYMWRDYVLDAQAALTAITDAGYRIVKDDPVAWLYRREAHTSVVRTYPAIHDDMEGWTEILLYAAAPGDET